MRKPIVIGKLDLFNNLLHRTKNFAQEKVMKKTVVIAEMALIAIDVDQNGLDEVHY